MAVIHVFLESRDHYLTHYLPCESQVLVVAGL